MISKMKQNNSGTTVTTVAKVDGQNTKILLAFLAGLLIGAIVAPIAIGGRVGSTEGTGGDISKKENVKNDDGGLLALSNSILVNDQLAGDRVNVSEVKFSKFGWAVVHEQKDGILGNALGAQKFEAGTHEDGYIYLLRNSEPENLYYVILYEDNGDFEFDLKVDTPLQDENGKMIMTEFNTIRFDRKTN